MKKYLTLVLMAGALGLLLFVAGCRTKQQTSATPPPPPAASSATTTAKDAGAAEKITIGPDEASCPVLGTVTKKSAMTPIKYNGKTYYICCADCLPKFKANPEKYIKNPAPPTREMEMPSD